MLNIPEEKIFILYEYENLKEDITFKDMLFNIIYDIKHYLGISISMKELKSIITEDLITKYLSYLSNTLDPYVNKIEDIIYNTKELYNLYSNKYINNIPTYTGYNFITDTALDIFLNSILKVDIIRKDYYSF